MEKNLKDLNMFECMANFLRVNDKDLAKEWYMLPISPKSPESLQGQHGDKSEDVRSISKDVLRHRIGLTYEAEAENVNVEEIINEILRGVNVP